MDTFGKTQAKVIPLDLSENQFQIYNKISRNYSHSFLFESLTGPEVLAETSVMGFDPKIIPKRIFREGRNYFEWRNYNHTNYRSISPNYKNY